jgi:hypothetical protein
MWLGSVCLLKCEGESEVGRVRHGAVTEAPCACMCMCMGTTSIAPFARARACTVWVRTAEWDPWLRAALGHRPGSMELNAAPCSQQASWQQAAHHCVVAPSRPNHRGVMYGG